MQIYRFTWRSTKRWITKAEIDRMASIIEEAVAEGAMGFSTSRIILHRDKNGDLTPGTMAQEAEMLAIGRAIAAGGGGVFEGAFDFGTYDDVPRNQADKQKMELFAKKEWHWMYSLQNIIVFHLVLQPIPIV